MKPLDKVVCPHCWHQFRPTEILWIARHQDLVGDPVAGPSAFIRFRATRFDVDGAALDARGLACDAMACPACHLPVPRAMLENNSFIFALIGIPASGKSYYLATMSWELRRLLPRHFAIAFNDADPLSNLVLNEAEKSLFLTDDPDELVALAKTEMEGEMYDRVHMDGQSVMLPHPFFFTLRPTGHHPAADTMSDASRILCFYDNAGEHFQPGQDSATSPATQYLAQARVFLFLFDPTQDSRFRERCRAFSNDPQLRIRRAAERQDAVLTEAALRIRTYGRLSAHCKLNKPLLVLVAKADVWGRMIDEDLHDEPILASHNNDGQLAQVDMARIEEMSIKVRSLLMEHSPEFVTAAEDGFQYVRYIPISALGTSPNLRDPDGPLMIRPKQLSPRWVTTPLLYAFAKWSTGLISSRCDASSE